MNINEIKKQLQTWGVSTSSPGLNGDDRFEELKHRYELYRAKEAKVGTQQGTAAPSSEAFAVPSLNNLSIGEIRARLTALGENTSTPGVTGQERRSVLMRRLIDSICGADDDDDLDAISSAHDIVTPPPEAPEPTPAPVSPADAPFDVAANTAKISSMKKELKRLQNQRAIFVASRLAGNSQDEELRFCETKLGKLETELGYYKLMLQKGENKMNSANIKSDFLVLNKDATSFYTEALISKLDTYRSETKELIREHRVRIKQEGEEHPQYGVAAEDALKVLLSEANLASAGAKSGTSAKVSRARQRLNDVRDIDSRLEGGKEQGGQAGQTGLVGLGGQEQANRKTGTGSPQGVGLSTKGEGLSPGEERLVSEKSSPGGTSSLRSSFLGKAFDLDALVGGSVKGGGGSGVSGKITRPTEPAPARLAPISPAPPTIPATSPAGASARRPPSDPPGSPAAESSPPQRKAETVLSKETMGGAGATGATGVSRDMRAGAGKEEVEGEDGEGGQMEKEERWVAVEEDAEAFFKEADQVDQVDADEEEEVGGSSDEGRGRSEKEHEGARGDGGEKERRKVRRSPSPLDTEVESDEYAAVYGTLRRDDDDDDGLEELESPTSSSRAAVMSRGNSFPLEMVGEDVEEKARAKTAPAVKSRQSSFRSVFEVAKVQEEEREEEGDNEEEEREEGKVERLVLGKEDRWVLGKEEQSEEEQREESEEEKLVEEVMETLVEKVEEEGERKEERKEDRRGGRTESREKRVVRPPVAPPARPPGVPPARQIPAPVGTSAVSSAVSAVRKGPTVGSAVGPTKDSDSDQEQDSDDGERESGGEKDSDEDGVTGEGAEGAEGADGSAHTPLSRAPTQSSDMTEVNADERAQIKVLRGHARVLEGLNDIAAAENVYQRALELDPVNIITLESFALFLHQKKGELARAEAFFNRGLQLCLPGINLKSSSPGGSPAQKKGPQGLGLGLGLGQGPQGHGAHAPSRAVPNPTFDTTTSEPAGSKVRHIIRFILSYAHFLCKSKGDVEGASALYSRGMELAPQDAHLLASYGHFLSQLGDKASSTRAVDLFERSLRLSPGNSQYAMWFGKLLKKMGKLGQAELMYKVALEQSRGGKMEPTAVCNYATFVFKMRKDPERACKMFQEGLSAYPDHKGLRKNFGYLVKAHPQLAGEEDLSRRPPRSAAVRAQRAAMSAAASCEALTMLEGEMGEEEGEGGGGGGEKGRKGPRVGSPSWKGGEGSCAGSGVKADADAKGEGGAEMEAEGAGAGSEAESEGNAEAEAEKGKEEEGEGAGASPSPKEGGLASLSTAAAAGWNDSAGRNLFSE